MAKMCIRDSCGPRRICASGGDDARPAEALAQMSGGGVEASGGGNGEGEKQAGQGHGPEQKKGLPGQPLSLIHI